MYCKKKAKRAAALKAVELLHKLGELDDHLLPIKRTELTEDLNFLFQHWSKDDDKNTGGKKKRQYNILVNEIMFYLNTIENLCHI